MKPSEQGLRRNAARLLAAALLLLFLTACGLTAPRASEGYADLESLGMRDTDQVMSLSIGPSVLRFAASHVDDDPEVRELLRSLDGIRIRIYEIDGDAGGVALKIPHGFDYPLFQAPRRPDEDRCHEPSPAGWRLGTGDAGPPGKRGDPHAAACRG